MDSKQHFHDDDGKPIVIEQTARQLSLQFDSQVVQTCIDLDDPSHLPLTGNRMMLAHLLFVDPPGRVLLAGCGGGALARWFHACLPDTKGIAVERSAKVIELAVAQFEFPGEGSGWQIVQADIRDYLAQHQEVFDFILFDLDEDGSTPDWLQDPQFLQHCRQHLTTAGVITINVLAHDAEALVKTLWPLRQAFPGLTCCLSHPPNSTNGSTISSNIMLMAFNSQPGTGQLAEQASQAHDRFGIEFDAFYQQLLKDNPPGSGVF